MVWYRSRVRRRTLLFVLQCGTDGTDVGIGVGGGVCDLGGLLDSARVPGLAAYARDLIWRYTLAGSHGNAEGVVSWRLLGVCESEIAAMVGQASGIVQSCFDWRVREAPPLRRFV